ncbi:MAG: serine hydrolase [Pseudomonadota bacterium]
MGKHIKYGLLGLLVIGAGAISYFWNDIRVLMSLREYVQIFAPDKIDENFRNLYEKERSIQVPRSGPVYALNENLSADVLPETYDFEGETRNVRELLERSQTTGLAILHDGVLIHEEYNRGNTRESLAIQMSVSKGMASFLIGVALENGAIDSVDDLVTKYVPELIGSAYEGVTLKQVLEMSSGVRWSEDYGRLDSDLVQSVVAMRLGSLDEFTASVPRENEPGTYNRYASIDTHVLGMVLRGATGKPYRDYFEEKLWSRLGAEDDAYLLVDTKDEPLVFGGVNIRLRDMVRFGELYLNGGRNFLGQQLVSENWVKTSTTPDAPRLQPMVDNPESDSAFGYKYQWWIPLYPDGDDYSAIGIYGQFIYINPARKIVIAKTSAYTNYTVDGGMMNHETLVALQAISRHVSPSRLQNQGELE